MPFLDELMGQSVGPTKYSLGYTASPDQYLADASNARAGYSGSSILESLLPTSLNLRNRGLQEILGRMDQSVEGLTRSSTMDKFMSVLGKTKQMGREALGARGMLGSGVEDRFNQDMFGQHLASIGEANVGAHETEMARRTKLLGQLFDLTDSDLALLQSIQGYYEPQARTQQQLLSAQRTNRWQDALGDLTGKALLSALSYGMFPSTGPAAAGGGSTGGFSIDPGWSLNA